MNDATKRAGSPSAAPPPAARLLGLVNGFRTTQAIYVAAKLGLPDRMADGPKSAGSLAAASGADPDAVYRLLRALTTLEIVTQGDDGAFSLTPTGDLLRSDAPDSLRSWTLYLGGYQWRAWENLLECVRTGEKAPTSIMTGDGFENLERDPELAATFHRAMVELTRAVGSALVRAYDFAGAGTIVDVGGGYGELLRAVLSAHPAARGVLFDLPSAIEEGRRYLEAAGVADRCEFVAGDFFEAVPAGADVYLLKSIIHDWNDERAAAILGVCRRAMAPGARLVLLERVLPERLGVSAADQALAHSDLNMLVSLGARERTVAGLRAMLEAAGLSLGRVVPTESAATILEATAAP